VLRLLKCHLPQSEIYWWIEAGLAPLLEDDPDLSGTVAFDRRRWIEPRSWFNLWRNALWMREHRFDWILDLQGLARSAFLGWLARGNLLVGLNTHREGARGFYDVVPSTSPFHTTHAVDWYLEALLPLGVPIHSDFEWLPERREVAAQIRRQWKVEAHRWLILQPGARWISKRWPAQNYAELVRLLAPRHPGLRFAILGSSEDRSLGQAIASANENQCLDLTGRISLLEMIEWIRLAEGMVTNDTGPMHVAAALDKPVVALFGPTNPQRTGPFRQIEHVIMADCPCAPCRRRKCDPPGRPECICLANISPATVAEAVERRILKMEDRR